MEHVPDTLTQARNRRIFAIVGGLLALLVVLAGLVAMLSVGPKNAAHADGNRSIVVTPAVTLDAN